MKCVCQNCIKCLTTRCHLDHCYSCSLGCCDNNITNSYCNECYVNPYEKYKGIIITNKMMKTDKLLNPYTINKDVEGYMFKCPNCKRNTKFMSIDRCSTCDKYFCLNCCKHSQMVCDVQSCKHKSCFAKYIVTFCTLCAKKS